MHMLLNQTFTLRLSSFAVWCLIFWWICTSFGGTCFPNHVVSQPRKCGLCFHLCGNLWVSACYPFLTFLLHLFLPISSMELYHHFPMCFHGEHRDRLLTFCSLTWCDPLLWCDRGKDKCWHSSTYFLPAPLCEKFYLQSRKFWLRYVWVIHCPVCDRCKIISYFFFGLVVLLSHMFVRILLK